MRQFKVLAFLKHTLLWIFSEFSKHPRPEQPLWFFKDHNQLPLQRRGVTFDHLLLFSSWLNENRRRVLIYGKKDGNAKGGERRGGMRNFLEKGHYNGLQWEYDTPTCVTLFNLFQPRKRMCLFMVKIPYRISKTSCISVKWFWSF